MATPEVSPEPIEDAELKDLSAAFPSMEMNRPISLPSPAAKPSFETAPQTPEKIVKKTRPLMYSKASVKQPFVVLMLSLVGPIICLVFALMSPFDIDVGISGFRVPTGTGALRRDAFRTARSDLQAPAANETQTQQNHAGGGISIYYEAVDTDNILTKSHFDEIRKLEDKILASNRFSDFCLKSGSDCLPPYSLLNYLYPSMKEVEVSPGIWMNVSIPDGKGSVMSDIASVLSSLATPQALADEKKRFFFDNKFKSTLHESKYIRSVINLGSPLATYTNSADQKYEQRLKIEEWAISVVGPILRQASVDLKDKLKMYWRGTGLTTDDVQTIVLRDAFYAGVSLAFVFCYSLFHIRSVFLTSLGVFQIVWSLPLTYAVFKFLAGFPYIGVLNFLGIFVLFAIGMDDIFIMTDAFNQSMKRCNEVLSEYGDNSLVSRLDHSYRRSTKAMFVTSMTTSVAFFANALSPIPPIQQFGIFSGLLIVCNYVLLIILYPAVLVVNEVYIQPFFQAHFMKKKDQVTEFQPRLPKLERSLTRASSLSPLELKQYRVIERACWKYAPILWRYRYFVVVLAVIVTGVGTGFGMQLQSDSEFGKLLPDDEPFQRYMDIAEKEFPVMDSTGFSNPFFDINYVWGILTIDRSKANRMDLYDLGSVIYNDDFNIADTHAQSFLVNICDSIAKETSHVKSEHFRCFISNFKNWTLTSNRTFPVAESEFIYRLDEFLAVEPRFASDIGRKDGSIKYVTIAFNSTLARLQPQTITLPEYNFHEDFMEIHNKIAPNSMKQGFQTSYWWTILDTEQSLLSAALINASTSVGIALIILIISSGNIILGLLAAACIVGVVMCVLGSMVLMGWKLGVIESVALTTVVGLSVDYTVHLATAYAENEETERFKRARRAVMDLGISIISSTVTSVGASLVLLICTVIFFVRFGIFMAITITLSCMYAMAFWLAFAMVFGPQAPREFGALKNFCK